MNLNQLNSHLRDPLYRNSLFLMANTLVTTGLGFFFWMVVARYYTELEVGLASAIISALHLLGIISTLGLNVALIRFISKADDPAKMINSCLAATGVAALIVTAVFIAGVDVWSPVTSFVRQNTIFLVAFFAFAVAWSLSGILDAVFIAKRRAEFTLIKNTIFSLLKIPLPIILVGYFHAFGIVSSWGIAAGIAVIASLLLFLPWIQRGYRPVPRLHLGIIRAIWRYSAGNYLAHILSAIPSLVLPIIIVNLLSPEQNAYFYVAWMISGLVLAIPFAVSQSLFAEASHFDEDLQANARRSLKLIVLLLIPAIAIVALAGKWLLLLFGQSYSSNALTLLWILASSSLFAGVNSVYYSVLRVRGNIRELVALHFVMAFVVLITSVLVMPSLGIVGIGYACIGAQALVSLYVLSTFRSRSSARKGRAGSS